MICKERKALFCRKELNSILAKLKRFTEKVRHEGSNVQINFTFFWSFQMHYRSSFIMNTMNSLYGEVVLRLPIALMQGKEITAVISNFWLRVRNRGIYDRGKKVVLYVLVTNPRHIEYLLPRVYFNRDRKIHLLPRVCFNRGI